MRIYIVKTFLISALLLLAATLRAQDITAGWDKATLNKANTAKDAAWLSSEEKLVIYYTNLVRLDPALFAKTILKHYLDSAKMKNSIYITSLYKDLQKTKAMDVLLPMSDLSEEAKKHAIDMGKSGKIGHNTSKGENFAKRIVELKKTYSIVFENCQYGYDKAIDMVIDLLVDEGISDYGHRKAILNSKLKYIGTSIQKHKGYRWNCVMEMGGDKN